MSAMHLAVFSLYLPYFRDIEPPAPGFKSLHDPGASYTSAGSITVANGTVSH